MRVILEMVACVESAFNSDSAGFGKKTLCNFHLTQNRATYNRFIRLTKYSEP